MFDKARTKGKQFAEDTLGLNIGDVGPVAITLGSAIIVISVVSLILSEMQGQVENESTAYEIIGKGLDSMSVFGDWFDIIVIVSVAAIILGLVMLFRRSASPRGRT